MKKNLIFFAMLLLTSVVLSGCLFPDEERAENQIPDEAQLIAVQNAVDQYKADTGVLPIKTKDQDTDIFIKYQIDFSKLVPKYLANVPGNSYEKGGIFQYIIWDPENNPTVKLVDLRTAETIRELNLRLLSKKYMMYKKQIADYVYSIDYKKLGYQNELTVPSPYTNNHLPLVASSEGKVYVDYSIDLAQFLKEHDVKPKPGEDIRMLLVEAYPVVPAYSLPYTVNENNEPVFMYDPTKNNE
ncbi:hypothetical protein NST62_04855 [Ureibacillus sp. FSL K6-8385]|uniref:DUF1672 family protein n=1 Tax=Ureibacillus terrenus TaxID=118246 RepID=A0A540V6J0_9BACL|nr:hypothetical protein [Ureibacillus terrenus]MED3660622.1 hypothetical protein [Ureibacillus terrenus]MED3762742.1 hypothetical protein [Ureibacillus terrenus]TQE92384.1 hypothetical protein FKZ59_01360 [Ureibacillus terrenus]